MVRVEEWDCSVRGRFVAQREQPAIIMRPRVTCQSVSLLITVFASAVSADELDGYVMAVYNHVPGHKQIDSGDYDKAIAASLRAFIDWQRKTALA